MIKPTDAATATATAHPLKDDRKVASQQLEAFFLRQLLQEARPESADGGFAGDTFKQMLDEQLADKMAASGGIGLAKLITPSLGQDPNAASTPLHALHPTALGGLAARSIGAMPITGTAGVPAGSAAEWRSGVVDGAIPPTMIPPIVGRPTSGYGLRKDPITGLASSHPGVDLAAPTGTLVNAAAAGKVTHAGPAGTYGNLVIVKHENGFETRYAHLSEVTVHEGDHVSPGELVGKVGTTGRSTGPHLHFEVRHDGKVLDPADLLPPLNRSAPRTNR